MEKIVLLHLAAHWGDLIEQIKKICYKHFKGSYSGTPPLGPRH